MKEGKGRGEKMEAISSDIRRNVFMVEFNPRERFFFAHCSMKKWGNVRNSGESFFKTKPNWTSDKTSEIINTKIDILETSHSSVVLALMENLLKNLILT